MPGFSHIAAPLHALVGKTQQPSKKSSRHNKGGTHTKQEFVWSSEAEDCFQLLKIVLTSTPVLGYPDFKKDFILEIDASLKGLGACLAQEGDDGKVHPLVYASRGLRGAERNYPDYSSFKLELLGLKWL